jgi:hypothetical protein
MKIEGHLRGRFHLLSQLKEWEIRAQSRSAHASAPTTGIDLEAMRKDAPSQQVISEKNLVTGLPI